MPSVGVVDESALVQQLEALAQTAKRKEMQMMPMLPTARSSRRLAKSVVAAALVLAALLPGLAYADQPRPPPRRRSLRRPRSRAIERRRRDHRR